MSLLNGQPLSPEEVDAKYREQTAKARQAAQQVFTVEPVHFDNLEAYLNDVVQVPGFVSFVTPLGLPERMMFLVIWYRLE